MRISTSGGGAAYSFPAVANPLTARMHKGINTTADEGQTPIIQHGGGFDDAQVAHAPRGEGFDASEDGTGRGTPIVPVQHAIAIQERAVSENPDAGPDGKGWRDDGAAYTLEARQVSQAVAFAQNTRDEVRLFNGDGRIAGALAAEPGMKQTTYVAFTAKDHGGDAVEGISPTLRAGGHSGSHANAGVMPAIAFPAEMSATQCASTEELSPALSVTHTTAVAFDMRGREGGAMPEGPHDTANIRAASGGSSRSYAASQAWGVRRLTPTECARLQGFPDDWARIPWRGKPAEDCPDGPQYRAYGNSMATNVVGWIGDRIQAVMDEQG